MAVKRVQYKGMTLSAGAFEAVEFARFVTTLSIRHLGVSKLFDPPCPPELFGDSDTALECAISFGRAIVDGEISGLDIDDLRRH